MTRRIVWRYRHYRGKKMQKCGEFFQIVRHGFFREPGPQLALVRFDGNKMASKGPLGELFEDGEL